MWMRSESPWIGTATFTSGWARSTTPMPILSTTRASPSTTLRQIEELFRKCRPISVGAKRSAQEFAFL